MKKLQILGIMGVILSVPGCSTNSVKDHVVAVGNMGDIKVINMTSMKANGFLVVQGYFHNVGTKPAQGFYQCRFYDANNIEIGDAQKWQPVTIYPDQDRAVKCVADETDATNFKIAFSNDASNVTSYK